MNYNEDGGGSIKFLYLDQIAVGAEKREYDEASTRALVETESW